MPSLLRFCYRKVIDKNSAVGWERLLWDSTHFEYRLQVQRLPKIDLSIPYSKLVEKDPKAKAIHTAIVPAAMPYIEQLEGKIPSLANTIGHTFMKFDEFKFDIIESHFEKKEVHAVSIYFISKPMQLLNSFGNILVLAENNTNKMHEQLTETICLEQPMLSIYSITQSGHE